MKQSAGTLLYRRKAGALEVLIVHPSGNYNRRAPWSIPKGLVEDDEPPEQTARRETVEETAVEPGELASLGTIVYRKSRKRIHCFCGPAQPEAEPAPACWEVDRAEFVDLERAAELIHPDQRELLDRLRGHLKGSAAEGSC